MKKYVELIQQELVRAACIHPVFPTDVVHQVAILSEEAGEAVQAANNIIECKGDYASLEKELIQTGAMVFRCLLNLPKTNTQP